MPSKKPYRVLLTCLGDQPLRKDMQQVCEEVGLEVVRPHAGRSHPLSSADLREEIRDFGPFHAFVTGMDVVDAAAIQCASKSLQGDPFLGIHRPGVGYDRIDCEAARQFRCPVTITNGSNHRVVAQMTLGLMLAVLHRFREGMVSVDAWDWEHRPTGNILEEKCWGIIGCGRIGEALAKLLIPHGVKILLYDPIRKDLDVVVAELDAACKEGLYAAAGSSVGRCSDLQSLLPQCQCLSTHVPLTGNEDLLDADTLRLLPDGAAVVNTARGGIVNEEAMAVELRRERLRYGADVFVDEFKATKPPLLGLPGFLGTPHICSQNEVGPRQMAWAFRNLAAVARGETPKSYVVGPFE